MNEENALSKNLTYRVKNLVTGQTYHATSLITIANVLDSAKNLEIFEDHGKGVFRYIPASRYANSDSTWLPHEFLEKI